MSSFITTMLAWGYPAVIIVIALEALGLPLPGEALMIAYGAAAGAEHKPLIGIFLAFWAGAVIGDNIGYLIGRRFGHNIIVRYGGRIGVTAERLAHAEAMFKRFGLLVVVVARFFVFLRQLNGVLAGSLRLSWWKFLAANAVGGAIWVGFWLFVSTRISANFIGLLNFLHTAKNVVFTILILAGLLAALFWLIYWIRSRQQ